MLDLFTESRRRIQAEGNTSASPKRYGRKDALADAIIDSAVVGGITLFSTLIAAPDAAITVAIYAAGLAFLVKLKELRNIK